MSANHILQNFLSAENFPEWKCGRLEEFSENLLRFVFVFLLTLAISSILSMIPDGNSGAEPTSCKKIK